VTHHAGLPSAAVMDWHVAALPRVVLIVHQLAHEVFQRKSALLEDSSLPILARYNVVGAKCRGGPNGDAFLSGGDLASLQYQKH
jgi:hypothetical protein